MQEEKIMAVPYNHKAIEAKWRVNWEKNPVNVNDGKSRNIIVWICFHTHLGMGFMWDIGEDM